MDNDKLNEAAEEARRTSAETLTTFGQQSYIDDVVALTDMKLSYDEVAEAAFVKGAGWLMRQPLSDRLTDSEKENIRQLHKEATLFADGDSIHSVEMSGAIYLGRLMMLEMIFGKDIFKEDTQKQSLQECKWMNEGICMKRTLCVNGVFQCPDFTPNTYEK